MNLRDTLRLALRNLREARLRSTLTTAGVTVGVAVIVTMVSFGLGLQRNTITRFKELDLFNEITVTGRSLASLAAGEEDEEKEGRGEGRARESRPRPRRHLDDAALAEIERLPGVVSVEPSIFFTAYVRANGRARQRSVAGAAVPNVSSRFQEFAAGRMIGDATAAEAVVEEEFVRAFEYASAAEVIGQTLEFLAPAKAREAEDEPTFFGLPLGESGEEGAGAEEGFVAARSFRIVGVLKGTEEGAGRGRRLRGLLPGASLYIPTRAAREWTRAHRGDLNEVAIELARQSGALAEGEAEGYSSAVIRVTDPVVLGDVRKKLTELGFTSFSILDQVEQIRTFFLIMNSVLGLLGGISLLVASLGIANTMLMSIFERTREIGIMKAIGAEDREIKAIFFAEAAAIGLAGGILGALAAWATGALANRIVYQFFLKPKEVPFVDFFSLPLYLWGGAILFAIVVSVAAALYPAGRAARIDPVRALRHD